MNHPSPRIAIPEPTSTNEAYNQRSLPQYVRAIEAAGGVAVPIPLKESPEVQASLLASCSAILLPGSPADVDPALYGEAKAKECADKDALREATDELLLSDAFSQYKPLLGICFGLQSLNVWRRGTLIQHLPQMATENQNGVNHEPGREVQNAHPVLIEEGSLLAKVLGPGESSGLQVNSSHHQAIARPGEGLRVVATSPVDGVIEALEATEPGRFAVAVQWHPERSYETSAASRALFAAFLDAARAWSPETR